MPKREWRGLSAYEDDYLMCRVYRHAWDRPEFSSDGTVRAVCLRCQVVRDDRLDSDYGVASRTYTYPEGYQIPKEFRPGTAYFRQRLLGAAGLSKGRKSGRSRP